MALVTIWVWTGASFVVQALSSKLADPAKLPKTQLDQGFYAGTQSALPGQNKNIRQRRYFGRLCSGFPNRSQIGSGRGKAGDETRTRDIFLAGESFSREK